MAPEHVHNTKVPSRLMNVTNHALENLTPILVVANLIH